MAIHFLTISVHHNIIPKELSNTRTLVSKDHQLPCLPTGAESGSSEHLAAADAEGGDDEGWGEEDEWGECEGEEEAEMEDDPVCEPPPIATQAEIQYLMVLRYLLFSQCAQTHMTGKMGKII